MKNMENDKNILDVQKRLFQEIKKNLPARFVLVDVISEALNIGSDAAYSRIRCDKLLNIKEAYTLCRQFKIPFDLSAGVRNVHQFDCVYKPVDVSASGEFQNYMFALLKSLEKLRASHDPSILMSATDIPIFHLISYKELIFFKLYTWAHSVYNYKGSLGDFTKEIETPEIIGYFQKISKDYELIPSTEIWMDATMDTTLKLISYYLEIGEFSDRNMPILLCEQVLQILDKLQQWAEDGKKGDGAKPFQFYLSEMEVENTYVLIKESEQMHCGVKLFTINGLNIYDKEFCRETEQWLTKLAQRSILLCGGSEKERIKFFNTQREKVQDLMGKINHSF